MKNHSAGLPLWIRGLGAFFILAAVLFSIYLYSSTGEPEILFVLIPSLLVITLCMGSFFFIRQKITVSETGVTLSYFPFYKQEIPLDQIREVKTLEDFSPARDSGGIGLRRSAGRVALANTAGTALHIRTPETVYIYTLGKSRGDASSLAQQILQEKSQ